MILELKTNITLFPVTLPSSHKNKANKQKQCCKSLLNYFTQRLLPPANTTDTLQRCTECISQAMHVQYTTTLNKRQLQQKGRLEILLEILIVLIVFSPFIFLRLLIAGSLMRKNVDSLTETEVLALQGYLRELEDDLSETGFQASFSDLSFLEFYVNFSHVPPHHHHKN